MKEMKLLPVSIKRTMELCKVQYNVGEDLLVMNTQDMPLPQDNRQMQCAFVGLCLSGEGRYTLGTIEYNIKPNDIIIVGEGQVLGDINVSDDFCGETLLISHDYLYEVIHEVREISNLFVLSRETPVFSVSPEKVMMFMDYIAMLKKKVQEKNHAFRRQIVGTILATMVYDLCDEIGRNRQPVAMRYSRSQVVFEEFIKLVEKNFRVERHVSWYSEQLGVSPKTLLEMVKRVSRRTPNEWLDIYTTLEIRLLLRHTTKSIFEISQEMHFGTQSSLGKFFKEHVGVSPTAYRQS